MYIANNKIIRNNELFFKVIKQYDLKPVYPIPNRIVYKVIIDCD